MFHRSWTGLLCIVAAILFPALCLAWEPANTARANRNVYGGYNYYSNSGRYLGRSSSNVFGGYNYYNNTGGRYNQTGKSSPSSSYRKIGK